MSAANSPVVFMMPGDLHLTEPGLPNHKTAQWAVNEANEFIHPDFVQFIGDNVQDATSEQFRLFEELTARLLCPWYAIIGDHDVKGDSYATEFKKRMGNPWGSLRLGGFRFVRLNTQEAKPVGLSVEQLEWLRFEVDDALAAGERVVLFQHNYPFQIWENFAGPRISDWRGIVQTRPIHSIFCGHTHYWQIANDGRNIHVATRSIGDPEGGPPGYTLAYLCGDDCAIAYRTIEDEGPLVLITYPRAAILCNRPEHVVSSGGTLRARIWSRASVRKAFARMDDGPPQQMKQFGPLDWLTPMVDNLAKGIHNVSVVAEDATGATGEEVIEFAVDPTGRYTAYPRVHPVVSGTKYC
jgi:3',5'-cyclic-AMP phosphodiesterase